MTADELRAAVSREAQAFRGTIGVMARRLDAPGEFEWNADEVFPAASIVKLPLLLEALRQVERGQLDLAQRVELRSEDRVGGSGVLVELDPGLRPTLRDLLTLMVVVSDNTATNLVLDLVGGTPAPTRTLREWGLERTTVVGKLMLPWELKNEAQKAGRSAETSPREAVWLLERLWRGELLGRDATAAALRILGAQQVREVLARGVPYGTRVLSKSGSVEGVRNDVGLLVSDESVVAVALMSKGGTDLRYHVDNEAHLSLARVAGLVFGALAG